MDLSKETDITKLKAIAYDLVVELQTVQNNIQAVNQRIAELEVEPEKK